MKEIIAVHSVVFVSDLMKSVMGEDIVLIMRMRRIAVCNHVYYQYIMYMCTVCVCAMYFHIMHNS